MESGFANRGYPGRAQKAIWLKRSVLALFRICRPTFRVISTFDDSIDFLFILPNSGSGWESEKLTARLQLIIGIVYFLLVYNDCK